MIEAGWYYDPAHSGWGLNIIKAGDSGTGVATLYILSPIDGQPLWLQAVGAIGGRMDVLKYGGTAFPGQKRDTRTAVVGSIVLSPPNIEGDLHMNLTLSPQAFFSGPQFSPPPPQIVWSGWLTKIA